ncbi:hypothetical protein DUNSADRAFT_18194 [Dunaliella salina]|uniref:Encoded protein n=1 Tax=Dunaliella salina TaxID=3046 RepID=A0ABQ7G0H3_DUNSA|nr:hypothetical protein DUNSADRAFT_18194 [Dunaliella salina]|eukprot:KAF5828101.1 hypothetical protein DUNSADRAFT_18194 [Dunaliella salina]
MQKLIAPFCTLRSHMHALHSNQVLPQGRGKEDWYGHLSASFPQQRSIVHGSQDGRLEDLNTESARIHASCDLPATTGTPLEVAACGLRAQHHPSHDDAHQQCSTLQLQVGLPKTNSWARTKWSRVEKKDSPFGCSCARDVGKLKTSMTFRPLKSTMIAIVHGHCIMGPPSAKTACLQVSHLPMNRGMALVCMQHSHTCAHLL